MIVRPICGLAWVVLMLSCGEADPAPAPAESTFPCEVERALASRCLGCHGDPPALGVPISFATFEATQVETTLTRSGERQPTWQAMKDVLEDGKMPLDPETGVVAPLPDDNADRRIIMDWLSGGAPPATDAQRCDGHEGA